MPHINHRRGDTRRSVNREVRCSCTWCGNPRHNPYEKNPQTRAERRFQLSADEQVDEGHEGARALKGMTTSSEDERSTSC